MNLPADFIIVGPDASQEECIAAWLKNLRNPAIKQKRGALRGHDDSMCCLGVAAATLGRDIAISESVLGLSDMKRFNLRTDNGQCKNSDIALSAMNDKGASFSVIADFIESKPEGLFQHEWNANPIIENVQPRKI